MTTVTTSKRKLIYKQDADGVFRLKKLDEPDLPDKKSVDDYLNDLVSCAYEVVDPNRPKDDAESVSSAGSAPVSPQKAPPQKPPQKSAEPEPLAMRPSKFSLGFGSFHIPSFVGGAALALVAVRMAPFLWVYGKIFFDYAKVGVLWAVILGAGAWYGGLIKTADLAAMRSRAVALVRAPKAVPADESDEEIEHFPAHRRRSASPVRRPTSPVRQPQAARRNTATTVMPFRPLTRDQIARFQSNPELVERKAPKLPRLHTADPQVRRRHDRRSSATSLEPNGEELPFINEVRLQDDHVPQAPAPISRHHTQPSMSTDLRRQNTTASKKSILGTRANYNRFLETAHDWDD